MKIYNINKNPSSRYRQTNAGNAMVLFRQKNLRSRNSRYKRRTNLISQYLGLLQLTLVIFFGFGFVALFQLVSGSANTAYNASSIKEPQVIIDFEQTEKKSEIVISPVASTAQIPEEVENSLD